MGNAYTPGLTVSGDIIVRRTRRLPIKGEVLVKVGDAITPDDVVARALLPGALQTIKLAEKLGVEAREARGFFQLKEGDPIEKGQIVAQTKGFLGLGKQIITSDHTGTVDSISDVNGSVLVREPSIPVEVRAYIRGTIAEVLPEEGVIVESRGAMVQGIFGVGGERTGAIRVAVSGPDQLLEPNDIRDDDCNKILVGGSGLTAAAIKRGSEIGVSGLIAGGIKDSDLIEFLGYDIGVAITGQEAINLTIMVTEGFGFLTMAHRTFKLLESLAGQVASINGATQIRAGVIRPEIIVPSNEARSGVPARDEALELAIGTPIRVIREPYFGQLGAVTGLPAQLMEVDSGTEVRVLKAKLEGGDEVMIPRANVEIMAS
ncbi:MAG: hypothetical protein WAO58_09195 [Fimbriimonadaceae bacterium]